MRIINRIGQALGHNVARTRPQSAIRRIIIHHTASPLHHTMETFENWWRNPASGMGNPAVGGYHEVIMPNGDVILNYNPTQISHGVANQNADTYHISCVGDFRRDTFGGAQRTNAIARAREAMQRFNIPVERVLGHNELVATACPAFSMNNFRNALRTAQPTPPTNNADQFTVTTRTGGFMTATDAANNRNRRNWIEPGTYHVFNRSQGMINVTTRQGTAGSWINPTGQGASTSNNANNNNTIRVGSRVRVNQNAQRWVTGQGIPNWVRGQTYTVQQMRNNNNELLLSSVMSWIRRNDVTLV